MGRARTIYGALAAVVVLAVGVPVLVPSMATLVTLILAKSIVVLGIIILLQAGQVSFGHAMFFAAGAYTAGFWGRYLGVGDLVGYLLVGTVVATLLGLLVGSVRGALPRDLLRHAQPRLLHGAVVAAGEDVPLHQRRGRHPHSPAKHRRHDVLAGRRSSSCCWA